MKKWKKKSFVLLLAAALLLTGCKGADSAVSSTSSPTVTPTPTPTSIVFEEDRYHITTQDGEIKIVDAEAEGVIAQLPYSLATMEKTGDGDSDGRGIAAGSYYLDEGTFAFVGGERVAFLGCVSHDGGKSWTEFHCSTGIGQIRRCCVDFWSPKEGVVAVGGDRMNVTESKTLFFTTDGGASWQEQLIEGEISGRLLNGVTFADRMHGILSLDVPNDAPQYWYTEDGGKTFTQLELPLPGFEGSFYFKADSLRIDPESGEWTLILGQGDYGQRKAKLTSPDGDRWIYEGSGEKPASWLG